MQKKKMKLKNLMDSNTAKNHPKKIKQAKFADIGVSFLNKKKIHGNIGNHQHSELIELSNNISSIGKGKLIY